MTFGPEKAGVAVSRWFYANPCNSEAEWRKVQRKVTQVIEILHKIKRLHLPSKMSKQNKQSLLFFVFLSTDNYALSVKKSGAGVCVSAQSFYQAPQRPAATALL